MSENAIWLKCDFQIHTPRDPNWDGKRPPSVGDEVNPDEFATKEFVDAQRDEWAERFIDACIDRKLQAIAVTDHHEMVMIPHIQKALAKAKKDDPSLILWLFPGMELTTKGGSQSLILFDSDLGHKFWIEAMSAIGISHVTINEAEAKGTKVVQLEHDYPELAKKLDYYPKLRNRYIILPNVSQGGKHTVVKDGAHANFKRMPYIGGYLDRGQSLDTLTSNKAKLSGAGGEWGDRPIYPLPTSDSRSASFQHLGSNDTWIKLATPSAEAIRQAFLAAESRISTSSPCVPTLSVHSIKINGSSVLQDTEVDFSKELNSAIGGRGSGKSTLLEYIAFGLGKSCYDIKHENFSGHERLKGVIKDTLIANSGSIELSILQDGASFTVTRNPTNAYEPQIKYPSGDTEIIPTEDLRRLFPSVIYCQGELSEIGKQTGHTAKIQDLLQFVGVDSKKESDEFEEAISISKRKIKVYLSHVTERWQLEAEVSKLKNKRNALNERIAALRKNLPKLSDDEQAKIDIFDLYSNFDDQRIQASKHIEAVRSEVSSMIDAIGTKRNLKPIEHTAARKLVEEYNLFFSETTKHAQALNNVVIAHSQQFIDLETKWTEEYKMVKSARDAVLKKIGTRQNVTTQIQSLQDENKAITQKLSDLENKLETLSDVISDFEKAIADLKSIVQKRSERTAEWAEEIETLSHGKIRAKVLPNGDISAIREAIDLIAKGTGSNQASRHRAFDEALLHSDSWSLLNSIRTELRNVVRWNLIGASQGGEKPDIAGIHRLLGETEKIYDAIFEQIDEQKLEALSLAAPSPQISFSYVDEGIEIAIEKASEGQRAAALLVMLLEQSGGPLIIDQPEGDLDNKIITDLTKILHAAKQKRQMIFASHNANIVVNGSSEHVSFIKVSEQGEREFAICGAIDLPEMREAITATMEGGKKAFQDRQVKYGF